LVVSTAAASAGVFVKAPQKSPPAVGAEKPSSRAMPPVRSAAAAISPAVIRLKRSPRRWKEAKKAGPE